jgi:hypothetical protein
MEDDSKHRFTKQNAALVVQRGVWRNAVFYAFATSWRST